MAESTSISWADATFNPWIGCTKVSTGPRGACEHCYAERDNKRHKWTSVVNGDGNRVGAWGAGTPRRRTKTWGEPLKWNRRAAESGYRPRIFCASLADVFDNEVDQSWRDDLWQLIRETPLLRWMLLTKRIGNASKMLPTDWPFPHVGLMATMATQEEWNRDFRKLAAVPSAWRGASVEPMLGPINLAEAGVEVCLHLDDPDTCNIDWIITGGESGPGFRTTNPDWVRSLRDQCYALDIAFHHKQWGGIRPKENGCMLDGIEHKAFPTALVAQAQRAVLERAASPARGGEWKPIVARLRAKRVRGQPGFYNPDELCQEAANLIERLASPAPAVTEEQIARAICCPGGCLRETGPAPHDCWAGKRTEEREQTRAVLAMIRGDRD